MNPKKQRRLAFAITLILAGGGAAGLAIYALGQNTQFFWSPTDLVERQAPPPDRVFRVGGLVQSGSVKRDTGLEVRFVVTDGKNSVPVTYSGVLPDLFREGQGVVALGKRGSDGTFAASEVLAKHDEKYMPPEVVDALKRSGHWKEGETPGSL